MKVDNNVSLSDHSTMGLGGRAAYLVEISSKDELVEAVAFSKSKNLKVLMIGSGSNIVWRDSGFDGLVIVNNVLGYSEEKEGETSYIITAGAGEVWDSVVERTVNSDLSGIEALSLIPGKVGATPVQNVGAYGQEISDCLIHVEAYDNELNDFVKIPLAECGFGYRTSRFKTSDRGRFYITSITLRLSKTELNPPFYASLATYLEAHNITSYSPKDIREAVINIRNSKLPDPAKVKNTGSFFANPIVSVDQFEKLKEVNQALPSWPYGEGKVKLSAAWLIEQIGFKNYKDNDTGMATWPNHALVLVNENAKSTSDLLKFKQKIVDTVNDRFGIVLEQEPELLP